MEVDKFAFKKDFFIKSRKEDIRNHYEFSPKVLLIRARSSAGEPMESSTRHASKNPLTPTASSSSSPRK
jgi:hypothetical protein